VRLQQQLEHERRRAEDEGKKIRPTTFENYIRACHTRLSKPLRVCLSGLSTQVSIISPKNKPCPTFLRPWADFPVTKMLSYGVEYRDVRPPDVLWNPEIRNVMLINFKRSEILK